MKDRPEREGGPRPSPALLRGLAERRLTVEELLAPRLLARRVGLRPDLVDTHGERVPARQLSRLRSHEPGHAA